MNIINQAQSFVSILVPTNFVSTINNDVATFKEHGLDLKNENVKKAAIRAISLVGMAFAGLVVGTIAWGLIWTSVKVVVGVGSAALLYLACHRAFENSQKDNQNKVDNQSLKASSFASHVAAAKEVVVQTVAAHTATLVKEVLTSEQNSTVQVAVSA